jgi:hypothetical protein
VTVTITATAAGRGAWLVNRRSTILVVYIWLGAGAKATQGRRLAGALLEGAVLYSNDPYAIHWRLQEVTKCECN